MNHQLKYPIWIHKNGTFHIFSYHGMHQQIPTDTNRYQQNFSFWMCWFTAIFHSISSEIPSIVLPYVPRIPSQNLSFHEVSWLSPCYSSSRIFDYVFIIRYLFIFDYICLVSLYYVNYSQSLPIYYVNYSQKKTPIFSPSFWSHWRSPCRYSAAGRSPWWHHWCCRRCRWRPARRAMGHTLCR